MLVLTRRQQEKIQIGDNITITVLRTKGKSVRLGIEAPGSVSVLRGEIVAARDSVGEQPAEESGATDTPKPEAAKARGPVEPRNRWENDQACGAGESDCREVTCQRVPKSRVATVLPAVLGQPMASGAGPLRAMLDRRGEARTA